MKIVSTSYVSTPEYTDPAAWLERISFYTGILEELAKQHDVASIERINYEGQVRQNGVEYFFLRHRSRNILLPRRIHRLISHLAPDIVLVNGLIFPLQLILLRMRVGANVKIFLLHRAEKPLKGLKKYFQTIADRFVNAYLFSSREFGTGWIDTGNISDQGKIFEVMQASSTFYPENRSDVRSTLNVSGSPVFLWVGRLDGNKDPLTIIKAFTLFLSYQPSAILYMIYQADDLLPEIIRQLNEDSTAAKRIVLKGKVVHKELQQWYNCADYILSGSHYEGSGIAVSEAMSCGCIPIVTYIPSFRMMTANGNYGFLYPAGDHEQLLSTLLKTREIDIFEKRKDIIEHFNKELSFEAIARKINLVIKQVS